MTPRIDDLQDPAGNSPPDIHTTVGPPPVTTSLVVVGADFQAAPLQSTVEVAHHEYAFDVAVTSVNSERTRLSITLTPRASETAGQPPHIFLAGRAMRLFRVATHTRDRGRRRELVERANEMLRRVTAAEFPDPGDEPLAAGRLLLSDLDVTVTNPVASGPLPPTHQTIRVCWVTFVP
jgi:hypothetical protein